MGHLCRVPAERAVRGKEVVAERESAPRDLRVARGFRRRPRVAFPRAGAERRPMRDMISATLCEMGGATGSAEPRREVACLFVDAGACASGEAAGAMVQHRLQLCASLECVACAE